MNVRTLLKRNLKGAIHVSMKDDGSAVVTNESWICRIADVSILPVAYRRTGKFTGPVSDPVFDSNMGRVSPAAMERLFSECRDGSELVWERWNDMQMYVQRDDFEPYEFAPIQDVPGFGVQRRYVEFLSNLYPAARWMMVRAVSGTTPRVWLEKDGIPVAMVQPLTYGTR